MGSNPSLRQTTRSLITLVEAQTGKQVVVQDEPALQTHATVRIARGDGQAHVIRYKPIPGEDAEAALKGGIVASSGSRSLPRRRQVVRSIERSIRFPVLKD
jgi:hypothetical protein